MKWSKIKWNVCTILGLVAIFGFMELSIPPSDFYLFSLPVSAFWPWIVRVIEKSMFAPQIYRSIDWTSGSFTLFAPTLTELVLFNVAQWKDILRSLAIKISPKDFFFTQWNVTPLLGDFGGQQYIVAHCGSPSPLPRLFLSLFLYFAPNLV